MQKHAKKSWAEERLEVLGDDERIQSCYIPLIPTTLMYMCAISVILRRLISALHVAITVVCMQQQQLLSVPDRSRACSKAQW